MENDQIRKIYNTHFATGAGGRAKKNTLEISVPGSKLKFRIAAHPHDSVRELFITLLKNNQTAEKKTEINEGNSSETKQETQREPGEQQQKQVDQKATVTPENGAFHTWKNQTYRILSRDDGSYAVWNETKDRYLKGGPVKKAIINSFIKEQENEHQYNDSEERTGPYFEETNEYGPEGTEEE